MPHRAHLVVLARGGDAGPAFNAISRRFQNLRAPGDRDPLAQLEIDPLRPLNNLLWGYVQDEQHRLSVLRRAYEYDHHYGFTLTARPSRAARRRPPLEVPGVVPQPAVPALQFYHEDDDTTVMADGFPVLNALKETHYLLAQGRTTSSATCRRPRVRRC